MKKSHTARPPSTGPPVLGTTHLADERRSDCAAFPGTDKMASDERISAPDATTFKHREDWMKAILASTEHHTVQRVALRLALYLNIKTGRCDPSYPTLVRDLGGRISERTVIRVIATLEAHSWIERDRRSGKTNQFMLLPPPPGVTPRCHPCKQLDEHSRGDTQMSPQGVTNPAVGGDKIERGGVTPRCHPNREENKEEEQRRGNIKETRAPDAHVSLASPPLGTFSKTQRRHRQTQAIWDAFDRGEIVDEDEAVRQVNEILSPA